MFNYYDFTKTQQQAIKAFTEKEDEWGLREWMLDLDPVWGGSSYGAADITEDWCEFQTVDFAIHTPVKGRKRARALFGTYDDEGNLELKYYDFEKEDYYACGNYDEDDEDADKDYYWAYKEIASYDSIEDAARDLMGFEVEDKTSNETKPNPAKAKGIKATCSLTKYLPCCGEYIQVAYDTEENEVFGIRQTQNSWTVFKDDSIIEVTNYYRPTTMKQIKKDLLIALNHDRTCEDILL